MVGPDSVPRSEKTLNSSAAVEYPKHHSFVLNIAQKVVCSIRQRLMLYSTTGMYTGIITKHWLPANTCLHQNVYHLPAKAETKVKSCPTDSIASAALSVIQLTWCL